MIIDKLLVALGYDYDDRDLKRFEEAVEGVNSTINTAIAAAAGLAAAFAGIVAVNAQATDEVAKAARQIGIAASELDAYNFAAEQSQGTSAGVAESLRQLSIRASEAAKGTGSALEAFALLDIEATNSDGSVRAIGDLLPEVADKLNALGNDAQRLELADKLGLGNLNLLLREGSAGIAALIAEARELGTITEEDARLAEEFNDQLNRLKRVFTTTTRFIATRVLPTFTKVAESIQQWVMSNRELITSGVERFLDILTFAMENFKAILIGVLSLKFAAFLVATTVALRAVGNAALLAQVKLFAIVLVIGAVIAALGLLIEDLVVFSQGGDSFFGPFLSGAQASLTDFFTLVDETFTKVKNIVVEAKNAFLDLITFGGKFDLSAVASLGVRAIPGPIGALASLAPSVLGGGDSSSVTNSKTITNNINVNGGDPNEVKRVVKEALNEEVQNASVNASSPLRS